MHAPPEVRFGTEATKIQVGSHICLLYRTEEERDRIAVPFVREGVRDGAICRYVVDDQTAEHLRQGLTTAGVAVNTVEASGQLKILTAADTYLRHAPFDYREMFSFWDVVVEEVRAAKSSYSRCAGETAFLQQGAPGLENFMEYEAKLNNYVPTVPLVVLCLYNLMKLTGDLVAAVLQTHPYAVLGGVLIRNPYYISPDQFLAHYKPARAASA